VTYRKVKDIPRSIYVTLVVLSSCGWFLGARDKNREGAGNPKGQLDAVKIVIE